MKLKLRMSDPMSADVVPLWDPMSIWRLAHRTRCRPTCFPCRVRRSKELRMSGPMSGPMSASCRHVA